MGKLNVLVQRLVPIFLVFLFVACPSSDTTDKEKIDLQDPTGVPNTTLDNPDRGAQAAKGMFAVSNDVGAAQTQGESDSQTISTASGGLLRSLNRAKESVQNDKARLAISSLYSVLSEASGSVLANNAVNRAVARSKIMAKVDDFSMACQSGSGTITADTGEINQVTYQLKSTFTIIADKCRQGSEEFSGKLVVDFDTSYDFTDVVANPTEQGTYKSSLTGSLIAGDGDQEAGAGDFTVVRYDGDSVSSTSVISLSSTFNMTTEMSFPGGTEVFDPTNPSGSLLTSALTFEGTGMITKDIVGEDNETILLDQLKLSMTAEIGGNAGGYSVADSMTFDGAMERTKGAVVEYLGFVNFRLKIDVQANQTQQEIYGKVVIDHTPDQCGDGSYNFDTAIALTTTVDGLTAGSVTVNGASIFVSDTNEITVEVGGEQKIVTKDEIDSGSFCPV